LDVHVKFTNPDKKIAGSYQTTYFRLKDKNDAAYQVLGEGFSKEYSYLGSGPILANENVRGGFSFMIPKGETEFRLIYQNVVIGFNVE
jgi:hypothetical protein